jgi:hypothetical protein
LAFTSSEKRFHAFEELSPHLSGEKWGRGTKRTDEGVNKNVRFGEAALAVLKVRP